MLSVMQKLNHKISRFTSTTIKKNFAEFCLFVQLSTLTQIAKSITFAKSINFMMKRFYCCLPFVFTCLFRELREQFGVLCFCKSDEINNYCSQLLPQCSSLNSEEERKLHFPSSYLLLMKF
jgi:hypothetical protein